MIAQFFETRLERGLDILRLVDEAGKVLLELRGAEIDDAIRAGFVDLGDCHSSMYTYARMRYLLAGSRVQAGGRDGRAARPEEPAS